MLLVVGIIAYLTSGYSVGEWMYDIYHARDKQTNRITWTLGLLWPTTVINNRRNKNRTRFERYHDCWEDILPYKVSKEYYATVMSGAWGFKLLWNLIVLSVIILLSFWMALGSALALVIALPLKRLLENQAL